MKRKQKITTVTVTETNRPLTKKELKKQVKAAEEQANVLANYNFHKAYLNEQLDREVANYDQIMARLALLNAVEEGAIVEVTEVTEEVVEAPVAVEAETVAEQAVEEKTEENATEAPAEKKAEEKVEEKTEEKQA